MAKSNTPALPKTGGNENKDFVKLLEEDWGSMT